MSSINLCSKESPNDYVIFALQIYKIVLNYTNIKKKKGAPDGCAPAHALGVPGVKRKSKIVL